MDGDTDTEADNTAEEGGGGGGLGGGGNKEDLKRLGTLDDDALRALTQRSPNAKSSRFNFYVNFGKLLRQIKDKSQVSTKKLAKQRNVPNCDFEVLVSLKSCIQASSFCAIKITLIQLNTGLILI